MYCLNDVLIGVIGKRLGFRCPFRLEVTFIVLNRNVLPQPLNVADTGFATVRRYQLSILSHNFTE